MSGSLSAQEATTILAAAFMPLSCSAERLDHHQKISFQIIGDKKEPVLGTDELLKEQFQDPRRLKQIIANTRSRLEAMGFRLKEWNFPAKC